MSELKEKLTETVNLVERARELGAPLERVKALIRDGFQPEDALRLASKVVNAKKPISRDLSWMDD